MDINNIEITDEIIEAVALAQLYREDAKLAIRKKCSAKMNNEELDKFYLRVLADSRFAEVKERAIELEKLSLINDDTDTIMLFYNKILQQSQHEGKYEAVLRILKEIRQLKAIQNDEMDFKVIIEVEEPRQKDNSDTTS